MDQSPPTPGQNKNPTDPARLPTPVITRDPPTIRRTMSEPAPDAINEDTRGLSHGEPVGKRTGRSDLYSPGAGLLAMHQKEGGRRTRRKRRKTKKKRRKKRHKTRKRRNTKKKRRKKRHKTRKRRKMRKRRKK